MSFTAHMTRLAIPSLTVTYEDLNLIVDEVCWLCLDERDHRVPSYAVPETWLCISNGPWFSISYQYT